MMTWNVDTYEQHKCTSEKAQWQKALFYRKLIDQSAHSALSFTHWWTFKFSIYSYIYLYQNHTLAECEEYLNIPKKIDTNIHLHHIRIDFFMNIFIYFFVSKSIQMSHSEQQLFSNQKVAKPLEMWCFLAKSCITIWNCKTSWEKTLLKVSSHWSWTKSNEEWGCQKNANPKKWLITKMKKRIEKLWRWFPESCKTSS